VDFAILVQCAFTLLGFLSENVTFKRFLVSDLTSSSYLEALFGTGVRFYLWHFYIFNFYTLLAFRTGGNLWSLVGNQDFIPKS
jgi:hypothetical protein